MGEPRVIHEWAGSEGILYRLLKTGVVQDRLPQQTQWKAHSLLVGPVVGEILRLRGLLEEVVGDGTRSLVMYDPNECEIGSEFPLALKRGLWTRIRQALHREGES